jgi:pyruvate-ferredoxin/flavodoxin oxidoreductase
MLMVRTNYDALVSGDGACAGCGEKSVLRSIAAVTEAYMRPVYHAKSDRFLAKAGELEKNGVARLAKLQADQPRRVRAAPSGHRASRHGPGRRRRSRHRARIAAYEAASTARSPTRNWSRPSPRSCSPRPSTTRTCKPSMAAWPTA